MSSVVVEFDIQDAVYEKSDVGSMLGGVANHRQSVDGLVFTVLTHPEDSTSIDSVLAAGENRPFSNPEPLQATFWALIDQCNPVSCWLVAHLSNNELEPFINDRLIETTRAREMRALSEDRCGCYLIPLPPNGPLHISRFAGVGHMPGFHLYAVPSGGELDLALRAIWDRPVQHRVEIHNLCWQTNTATSGAIFEIMPFGVEDRDHVAILLPGGISTSAVREIVKQAYGLPYLVVRGTANAFMAWKRDGDRSIFRVSCLD